MRIATAAICVLALGLLPGAAGPATAQTAAKPVVPLGLKALTAPPTPTPQPGGAKPVPNNPAPANRLPRSTGSAT